MDHDTPDQAAADQGTKQVAKGGKTSNKVKPSNGYYIKYTDIHQPDKEDQERQAGISDIYTMLTIGAGAYTYFYRNKIVAWLCVYLFYCNVINQQSHAQLS